MGATQLAEDVLCEVTLFRGRSSPTTSYQTMPQNAGSFQNCRDNTLWFWSSAAEATAPRTVGRPKDSSNCIASSRSAIADLLVSARTTSLRRTNIAPASGRTGLSFPTCGARSRKISTSPKYTDPDHNPMIPHVIVLEPGLIVHKIYNGYWFFGRPTLEDLRQDLRTVTRKCRPDWDIATPEMRAAWKQGRKDLFYPYGKTYVQTIGEQD